MKTLLYFLVFVAGTPLLRSERVAGTELVEKRLSPFVLDMARKEIAEKQRLVDLLQGNVPNNVKLYKAEQERIDFVLDRFEGIGR